MWLQNDNRNLVKMLIVLAVVIELNSCAVTVDEMSTLKSYALSDMRKELEGRDVSILKTSNQQR